MAKKKASKAKKAGKKSAAPRSHEMVLVASKVKELIRGHDCNTAGDALEGLNGWVHWLVEQACKRAQANGRKTVRPHDFIVGSD